MQEPEPVRLVFFSQEVTADSAQIFLNVKSEEFGYIRWPVKLAKAADLNSELSRMLSVGIKMQGE